MERGLGGEVEKKLVLSWLLTTGLLTLITVPLAWQRYYLPWTLAAVTLAGLGLDFCWRTGQSYALTIFGWNKHA
jgi:hypothetical protein